HSYADLDVTVETNAIRRNAKCRGLAYIVEQRTPGERWRTRMREFFQEKQGVHEDIALGMVLRRLLNPLHGRDFGQDLREEPGSIKKQKGAPSAPFDQHFG